MIKFIYDKIPAKISPCPIKDAVVEIRHLDDLPLEVTVGLLYNNLKIKEFAISVPERLAINDMPLSARQSNEILKNQAHYIIDCGITVIRIGLSNISIAAKEPYPGWSNFSKSVATSLDIISSANLIKQPIRIGLRYSSFFVDDILINANLKLNIFGNNMLSAKNYILTGWQEEKLACTLQISNTITVNHAGKSESGSIIDIDVSTKENEQVVMDSIIEDLNYFHDYEKKVFFNLLNQQFLNSLNPSYINE